MITSLQLTNFKGWKHTGPIRMAPLTVLFGTNSSGKSSLGQFLLMLKQTVDSSDRKLVINPGDGNTPVNLGSFEELIHGRNASRKLEFCFTWELPEPLNVRDPRSKFRCTGDRMQFLAEVGTIGEKHAALAVHRFEYGLMNGRQDVLRVSVVRQDSAKGEYKLEASPYVLIRKTGRGWALGAPTKFYRFPDQIPAYYQNADFVQDFSLQIEELFRSVSYLGPLRNKGERLYNWGGGEPESVGDSGENTISALLAAKDRRINTAKSKTKKAFQQLVAEQLQQLELIDEFDIRQISSHRKEYEVKVRTPGSLQLVDIPDVGFGISQVLPVVVQCFYAPPGAIVFIEQPELHLHPRAQAHLADLFIDVLASRERGIDRKIQLVIETHSEHFLYRLQRRIAEASADHPINADQVAAYFAHSTGTESKLDPLEFNSDGDILNWPENFFGDGMGDLIEKSKAAARRHQHQHKRKQAEAP